MAVFDAGIGPCLDAGAHGLDRIAQIVLAVAGQRAQRLHIRLHHVVDAAEVVAGLLPAGIERAFAGVGGWRQIWLLALVRTAIAFGQLVIGIELGGVGGKFTYFGHARGAAGAAAQHGKEARDQQHMETTM